MPSVLLIDNSDAFLPDMAHYLTRLGCEVAVALTVHSGLDLVRRARPQIIAMDVHMRDMDGLEAMRSLQADYASANIPVIALTAQATDSECQRYLLAGAAAYVSKSVERESLAAIILAYARRSA